MTKKDWMHASKEEIENMTYQDMLEIMESHVEVFKKNPNDGFCNMRPHWMRTLETCIEILKEKSSESESCEDAIDRQALRMRFNHLDEVYEGMSEEEKHEAYIYGQIIRAIDDAPPVTLKNQKTMESVLDEIRTDIENHCGLAKENRCRYCSYCHNVMGVREILEVIDKYKQKR